MRRPGGMGLLLCQMCRALGARVFGTVSTEAKSQGGARRRRGHRDPLHRAGLRGGDPRQELGDEGLAVAYGLGGRDHLAEEPEPAPAPRDARSSTASRPDRSPPIDPLLLSQNGSLFVTRPTLGDYAATTDELRWRAGEVLDSVASGKLQLTIDRELPLAQAAEAHRLLEGRATTGKLILRP